MFRKSVYFWILLFSSLTIATNAYSFCSSDSGSMLGSQTANVEHGDSLGSFDGLPPQF